MLKHTVQEKNGENADLVKCRVKIYKINMQRCPYIHEMKERLLGDQVPPPEVVPVKKPPTPPPSFKMDQQILPTQPVATVVKLNPDGYGSHTSPTHLRADQTPLMPQKQQEEEEVQVFHRKVYPKNAKTSLFIIMSFVYAKLLVVLCIAYVFSDVVTHNIPLYYYEGFFTYLYGISILFLLYVFCFLLQESACCAGEKEPKVKSSAKKSKEQEKKLEEEKKKKEDKEQKKKEEKEKKKDKDKKAKKEKSTYRRNSEGVVDANDVVPVPVHEFEDQSRASSQGPQPEGQSAPPPPAPPTAPTHTNNVDVESGAVVAAQPKTRCRRKTTQNELSQGSFFLRIGAIAFGLGTMIYNGLEFGVFFEIPFNSPCYMILRGVNPLLQMIFTFMQMYFIFMNSRLNIHRFKVVARFGLMHVVATNLCVWIRTLVLEYIKEITLFHKKLNNTMATVAPFAESIKQHSLRNANAVLGTHVAKPDVIVTLPTPSLPSTTPFVNLVTSTVKSFITTTLPPTTTTTTRNPLTTRRTLPTTMLRWQTTAPTTMAPHWPTLRTTVKSWYTSATTPRTVAPSTYANFRDFFDLRSFNSIGDNVVNVAEEEDLSSEMMENLQPQAFLQYFTRNFTMTSNDSCGRINIMGTIVQDSAPYLYPFIIEYCLIGAAVIYCMWKQIGHCPRYVTQEDLEHRLEIMLSRRAVAMAQSRHEKVDCNGASKGLFFGLLMLVAALICLILFFVMINHKDFWILGIYLADVSHCVLMAMSIFATIIGFFRVRHLKFKTEEQSVLNDILLRVSAFGLFMYAVFTVIAGYFQEPKKDPNLLVMVTGILSVFQVILQLLFIADVSRRRVHLPEHDRTKPGRQIVTFLLICNITMWIINTFEMQKVESSPIQKNFYGFLTWAIVQRITLPLCIFHRFHSAVTLAEIWKTSYKARLE